MAVRVRASYLRSQLDRARQRLAYARAELRRFESAINDADDARRHRQWQKLADDVKRAETDLGHAQAALRDVAFDDVFRQAAE